MANKGTQALLASDIFLIKRIANDNVDISVSTTDVAGVKKMNLPIKEVTYPMVDIPYEKADVYAKRFGYKRQSIRYKLSALASFFNMFLLDSSVCNHTYTRSSMA